MSTPDGGAKRLGEARMRVLLAFARLNLAVLEHPTQVPDDNWADITDAADELVSADVSYRVSLSHRTSASADPKQAIRDKLRAATEPQERASEPVFTLNEIMQIFGLWEESARDNLEEARTRGENVSYFTGMVDALAHVRNEFERRGFQ